MPSKWDVRAYDIRFLVAGLDNALGLMGFGHACGLRGSFKEIIY
jgi:hypothetical protein